MWNKKAYEGIGTLGALIIMLVFVAIFGAIYYDQMQRDGGFSEVSEVGKSPSKDIDRDGIPDSTDKCKHVGKKGSITILGCPAVDVLAEHKVSDKIYYYKGYFLEEEAGSFSEICRADADYKDGTNVAEGTTPEQLENDKAYCAPVLV